MAESRGKLFEREFRRGLEALCGSKERAVGRSIRLFDGANLAKQKEPADFIYASTNDKTFMIECKSTSENSLPFANIREHQIPALLRWDGLNRVGLVAVEFWRHGRAFLIQAHDLKHQVDFGGRKSLTLQKAEEIGIEIHRERFEGSYMYDLSCLEREWTQW